MPFDIGIVATSSTSPWLGVDVLALAPIWIDDSHPRAASIEVEAAIASSTLYLECFLRGPHGLCQCFPFRLPTSRDCYSCFAEAFICWQLGMKTDFSGSSHNGADRIYGWTVAGTGFPAWATHQQER